MLRHVVRDLIHLRVGDIPNTEGVCGEADFAVAEHRPHFANFFLLTHGSNPCEKIFLGDADLLCQHFIGLGNKRELSLQETDDLLVECADFCRIGHVTPPLCQLELDIDFVAPLCPKAHRAFYPRECSNLSENLLLRGL